MTKLIAQGHELLDPGRYVLEVAEAEAVSEYGPQLKLRLRVAEGEHGGFEFTDYPNRGAEDGVKVGTKAALIALGWRWRSVRPECAHARAAQGARSHRRDAER